MFDDFHSSTRASAARRRMGGSVVAASVIYGLLGFALIGGATAATSRPVEELTQVEFAASPPPPPPPPPPPAADALPPSQARPKAKRKELKPPSDVPKEKLKESDAPLADSTTAGPVDGFLNGVEGGTGTKAAKVAAPEPPPPRKPDVVTQPIPHPSNQQPPYSATAKRKEVEGVVVVAFDVLENGSVANATIVSGAEELRESVLKTVNIWRFQPAKRNGQPIRQRLTRAIRFRLTDS